MEELVGSGAFGKVYKGKWRGSEVAIKVLNGDTSPTELQDFNREAKTLRFD